MKPKTVIFPLLFFLHILPSSAAAQCQLANPSFELPGGGNVFSGWNQFGNVGASQDSTTHGAQAASITGPSTGGWDVSAFWQRLDSNPGDQWSVTLDVGHGSENPLTGNLLAIVNIEWRNAANDLISFESHPVADASTMTDIMQRVEILSSPAPPDTVATHLLLGVLQSPAGETGAVIYDLVAFEEVTSGGLDALQWNDFPGGNTLEFANHSWRVKGPGLYGPGPNQFADSPDHVWVDAMEQLHLTVRQVGGTWFSTEIALDEALGYGDYRFTTTGQLDLWAPNVVLGLFLWQYPHCYDPGNPWNLHNEIDVEISRWGDPGNDVGQFVTQPFDYPGNIERFPIPFTHDQQTTSFAFRWLPDRVEYRAWLGGLDEEGEATPIHTWTYLGPHIPRPEQPRLHLNFWQLSGPPSDGLDHEVIISDFAFHAAGGGDTIPAVSDWGMVWLALAFLTIGTHLFKTLRHEKPVQSP